jgi:predicted acetyltransferase
VADLRTRDLAPDDFEALLDVRTRSFGPTPDAARERSLRFATTAAAEGRLVGVVDGQRPIAAGGIWAFEQWWRGRTVPLSGLAGVVVDPLYRGRGVATLLCRAMLRRGLELGLVASALYPAIPAIYRSLGFEYGGARHRYSFRADAIRALGRGATTLRRATADDAERLLDLVSRLRSASAESGPLVWPVAEVRDWLDDEATFAYLAADGFVAYTWSGRDLEVQELVALSDDTTRELWSVVGSGSSITDQIHAYVAPHDPVHALVGREAAKAAEIERWMLRLVDTPAAIRRRGWPRGAEVEAVLWLEDTEFPANAGHLRLTVAHGEASLTTTDEKPDALRLGPRGLAALYAGSPVSMLRLSGLAAGGDPDDDALLDTAFGGPSPFMLDFF